MGVPMERKKKFVRSYLFTLSVLFKIIFRFLQSISEVDLLKCNFCASPWLGLFMKTADADIYFQ
jgi:hypothetical protein